MERIVVGDEVIVVSGDDAGKRGKVARVIPETNRVVIEGRNLVKRHMRATQQGPGGILEVEAPINASNVMPIDPETGKPTRVRFKVEDGKKVRIAKSGAVIPAPSQE